MGQSIKIKLKGEKKLAKALAKRAKLKEVRYAIKDAGEEMERVAKEKVPEGETGDLKESINSYHSMLAYIVTAEAPYAQYVEFGTRKHGKAQPFMKPAQKAGRKRLRKNLRKFV